MNSGICGHEFLKMLSADTENLPLAKLLTDVLAAKHTPYEHMATQKNCYFKTFTPKTAVLIFSIIYF